MLPLHQRDLLGTAWENQTPTSSFVAMCNIHFTKAVKNLVEDKGIEPLTHACKAHVFPLAPIPRILGITNFSRISYADTESTSLMHRFTRQHCWFGTPWWCDSGVGDRDRTCIVLICNQLPSLSAHTHIIFGGVTWSRTKNVYHKGTDLQSADAHAIASITP